MRTAPHDRRGRIGHTEDRRGARDDEPRGAPARTIAELAGEIGATVVAPITRAATLPARAAQATAVGGTIGAVEAAGRGDDVIDGALIGIGFGAGFQALTEGGRAIARKIQNAKAGKFANEEVKQLVDTAKQRLSIATIALDAGFNSQNTFYNQFKKHTGTTPSKYKKSVTIN